MITTQENRIKIEENAAHEYHVSEAYSPLWVAWPVSWSAVWVGALASLAAILLGGLIGTALGFHLVGPENRIVDLAKVGFGTLAFSVFSAFLASVIGGWISGKVAGITRADPAMLHGAISWLLMVPILVALAGLGAGSYFGGWYGGLSGSPAWAAPTAPYDQPAPLDPMATPAEREQYAADRADYRAKVREWREQSPRAARNAALGAATALLLGLMGSVIGGWMASGEPMTLTYRRARSAVAS